MGRYVEDIWPTMPDGAPFDGIGLLPLVRSGHSPFQGFWDVNLLILEIEKNLGVEIVDIPTVSHGSNNYGIHLKTAQGPDLVARLARGDVNMPSFVGLPNRVQIAEVKFEAVTYQLLSSEADILVSRLLYYRIPTQYAGPRSKVPRNIAGRRLMVFERAEGGNDIWDDLDTDGRISLLAQAARIRASLFNFNPPINFSNSWLLDRLFEHKPRSFQVPVAATREFCIHLFESKIHATIGKLGDMIGWESDNNTVGPIAVAAKQSLLRLVPHIMPSDDENRVYRLVLEHGDYGIHNMSVTRGLDEKPLVTSVYDWETGCIIPALLSEPLMAVTVDLVVDENAKPSTTRVPDDADPEDYEEYQVWSETYFEILFKKAPDYKFSITAGKDARHLWFALQEWRGENPEAFFGDLGRWAEQRIHDITAAFNT